MPSLQPKPKAGQKWLPTQVLYGVDTSDPDPNNWKAFGQLAAQPDAVEADRAQPSAAKSDQPKQSAREQ